MRCPHPPPRGAGPGRRPRGRGCASRHGPRRVARPWATVNVCDTGGRPDTVGIRGSMPGVRRGPRMHMRFRVQYRGRTALGRCGATADSGWERLGGRPAASSSRAGASARAPGRGAASCCVARCFRWRRGGDVRRRRLTAAGPAGPRGRTRRASARRRASSADASADRAHRRPALLERGDRWMSGRIAAGPAPGVRRPLDGGEALDEQPRVVRDHAGDAERLEPADPRGVVDRPDVELAAGVADGARRARA